MKANLASFFKKTWGWWALAVLVLGFTLGDYILFTTYDLVSVSVVNGTSPDKPCYYSTADFDASVNITMKLTKNGAPVQGHSLAAYGKTYGMVSATRQLTDKDGLATFVYVPNPQYRNPESLIGQFDVYDEDNSIVIEFRLERVVSVTMVAPPEE